MAPGQPDQRIAVTAQRASPKPMEPLATIAPFQERDVYIYGSSPTLGDDTRSKGRSKRGHVSPRIALRLEMDRVRAPRPRCLASPRAAGNAARWRTTHLRHEAMPDAIPRKSTQRAQAPKRDLHESCAHPLWDRCQALPRSRPALRLAATSRRDRGDARHLDAGPAPRRKIDSKSTCVDRQMARKLSRSRAAPADRR